MKILFSNPPWWEGSNGKPLRQGIRAGSRWPFTRHACHEPDAFRFGGYLPFPFFMGYAASYAQREFPAAQVVIRDSIARGESYVTWAKAVVEMAPDFIVIESATPSWEHDLGLIMYLRRVLPGLGLILAGPIAAAKSLGDIGEACVPRTLLGQVQGEYEKGVCRVIRGERGLIPHDLLTRDEMNAAPAPMFDEACAQHYWDACPVGQQAPQLQVWSSRGCPHKCIFCVWPAVMTGNDPDGTRARSVRHYSLTYMNQFLRDRLQVAELRGTPYRSIYFDDDTFNLGDKHVLAMCEVMKGIGLPWSAMCRADSIKRETWLVMKQSGCFGVKLGFESGNQYVVDQIVNKKLDLTAAAATVHYLKSLGMTVHGTFTYGLPGETAEQREDTKRYIASLPFDSVQESGTAEIEGTPLHTLRQAGHLDKYVGASMAEGYQVNTDGQRKIEEIRSHE